MALAQVLLGLTPFCRRDTALQVLFHSNAPPLKRTNPNARQRMSVCLRQPSLAPNSTIHSTNLFDSSTVLFHLIKQNSLRSTLIGFQSSMFIDEIDHMPGMVLKMGRTSVKGRESIIQSLPAYCAVFSPP